VRWEGHWGLVSVSALLPLVIAIAACAASTGDSRVGPSPTFEKVPPSGLKPPTSYPIPASNCIVQTSVVDSAPNTMENVAGFSSAVVIGTFDGYGEAAWNTQDGKRPTNYPEVDIGVLIYRPVGITPDTVLRGSPASGVNARVVGGQVGRDSAHYSDEPILQVGGRYVFFVQPEWDPKNTRSTDPWVIWAWPVNANDMVQTPLEGEVPVSTLARIVAGTPMTVPPTPMPRAAP
jgi:hypothetical protein